MEFIWIFQGQKMYSRVQVMPGSLTVLYIIEDTRLIMLTEKFTLSLEIYVRYTNAFSVHNVEFFKVNLVVYKIATGYKRLISWNDTSCISLGLSTD